MDLSGSVHPSPVAAVLVAALLVAIAAAPVAAGASSIQTVGAISRGGCVESSKPFGIGSLMLSVPESGGGVLPTTVNYPTPVGASGAGATPVCGKFPLIVAGHGAQGSGQSAASLHAFLTQRGYVVAAPSFPSGFDFERMSGDVRSVITALLKESGDPLSTLHGVLKRSRVGYIGTSMGGMVGLSMYRSCCLDARIDAVVSKIGMAPAGTYGWGEGPPLLMINGDADTVIPYDLAVDAYESAHRPKGLITLAGIGHDLNVGNDPILRDAPLGFFSRFLRHRAGGLARVKAAVVASAVASLRSGW